MNKRLISYLITIFLVSFLIVYFSIQITQSAYSNPSKNILTINGMTITLGPAPNSTNVRLDTKITIDTLSSVSVNNPKFTPEIEISHESIYVSGPLTYEKSFYPSQFLKSGTSYQVSVTITDILVSWRFSTTSEPFNPGLEYFLATNTIPIAFIIASLVTIIVGFWLSRFIKKKKFADGEKDTVNLDK